MRIHVLAAEDYARKRLLGKRVKNSHLAKLVADDLLSGYPITHIAQKLGYSDRKSIYTFKELAVSLNYLEITPEGKISKPIVQREAYIDEDYEKFLQDDLIVAWSRNMQQRKAGKPIRSYKTLLASFYRASSSLKMKPSHFLLGDNQKAVLDNGREAIQNFKELYEAGKVKNSRKNADISHVLYSVSKAVRDFMNFNGFPYPRGEKGVMSQSINSFKGKYAHIKLTPEQIQHARDFIRNTNGFDSDLFRTFFFGLESCSRRMALLSAKLDYEKLERNGKTVYVMSVFESKTQEIKGGVWKKYIMDPELQMSIDEAKKTGEYLIKDRSESGIKKLIADLKEVYQMIKPNDLEYVMAHSFHALRHFGAHYHLSKCKYNYSVVAKIGGWNTTQEVEQSYGEMPADVLMDVLFE